MYSDAAERSLIRPTRPGSFAIAAPTRLRRGAAAHDAVDH